MTRFAILALIIAAAYAASSTLPVTQDFAVVNQDRISSVIARTNIISLFNNGLSSSISYYGIDTTSFLQEASITTNSPVASMIESATLVFKNFTILAEQSGAINIQLVALNPGQLWDESTMTVSTTPTIDSTLGTVDFSAAEPSLDVTNFFVKAISGTNQGGLFGFQIGLPGGPVEVPSHRADADGIVVEVMYSPMVGPGGTGPQTTTTTTTATPIPPAGSPTTTTTRAPATTSTTAPVQCWTCGAGWVHYFEVPGATMPDGDPCGCIRIPTTTAAPSSGSSTSTALPTSAAPPGASTTNGPTTTATNQPERNGAGKVAASVLAIAAIVLML